MLMYKCNEQRFINIANNFVSEMPDVSAFTVSNELYNGCTIISIKYTLKDAQTPYLGVMIYGSNRLLMIGLASVDEAKKAIDESKISLRGQ
jgi:hypothetical protein